MNDDRLKTIRLKLRRPAVLRECRGIAPATKNQVLGVLDEEARALHDSDPGLATALRAAADVLEVLATDETALHSTTDDDAEWLLSELSRRQ